jgi:hypothetical protein
MPFSAKKWNREVTQKIIDNGTYCCKINDRLFHIEVERWNGDKPVEFRGWFADNHSVETLGKTPLKVYYDA